MRPMLATRGTTVPRGSDWTHEVKWDGMRVIATVARGRLRLQSRNENDVTVSFPELAGLAEQCRSLGHDLVLDGEVVAMAAGIPTFGALADRMHVQNRTRAERLALANPVTLLAFDLLVLDGRELMGQPLSQRRAALESLGLAGPHWQVPTTYDDGQVLLEATGAQGLEGIVSKRLSSVYVPGRRTSEWLKFPNRPSGSYVVGGWRLETDNTSRLGALLVGEPCPEGLRYRGRVGSGIAGRAGPRLKDLLAPLTVDGSPFCDEVPAVDARGTTWVRPEVVVEVACLGVTRGGRLRQPSYLGVRSDVSAADLAGELAQDTGDGVGGGARERRDGR